MKLYECIIDDGKDVFKEIVPVKNKKQLFEQYGGNGDFVKIKDVTGEYLNESSIKCLNESLVKAGWGEGERKMLCALLEQHLASINKA